MTEKSMRFTILLMMMTVTIGLRGEVYSLDSLLRRADEESVQLRVSRTALESAEEGLKHARNQMLPTVQVEGSVGYLGNGQLWDRDFSHYTAVENPHLMNNFAVRAQQVIYSGGALSSSYRLSQMECDMATLTMAKDRQEVRFVITGHYLDLCCLRNQVAVLQENICLTDTLISLVRVRVAAGTALDRDITRYELQLANLELQLERVKNRMEVLSYQLVSILHLSSPIEVEPMEEGAVSLQSHSDWQGQAKESSISLKQADMRVRMQEQEVRLSRSAMIPKILFVAEDHLDGPITIEVPVLDKNFNYWFMGVGVQYDLSSVYKSRRAVRQSRLALRQAREERLLVAEQTEQAIQSAYSDWLTAIVEVHTQEQAVELSKENYRVTRYRYENGLCLLTDMLDAGNEKLSAELGLVNAQISVQYNQSKLMYLTSSL